MPRADFQRAWERFTGQDIGKIAQAEIEIVDLSMDMWGQPKWIDGKVKNNSDRNYSRVEVTFDLMDGHGSALGAEKVSVNNVGAKSSVAFRATIRNASAANYLIRDIQVF
jgi:hypothetical protein